MSRSLIIARHASRNQAQAPGVTDFREVRNWVTTGKILGRLFRYDQVRVVTHLVEVLPKPFISALIARVLSRGETQIEDQFGTIQKINARALVALFRAAFRDWRDKGRLLRETTRRLRELDESARRT